MSQKIPEIAMVAGEASGDLLGASLMRVLLESYPSARFYGIGGPKMQALGFDSWVPMEKLSIMGLVEVLKHLPELLRIRTQLRERILGRCPDLFLGIDAPDFNLPLEKQLRDAGLKTAHYVSPSVWAWRTSRIKKIKQAVDLMLTLFPFEEEFYQRYQVPVTFVGHPLADEIVMQPDQTSARQALNLDAKAPVLALLPGSRGGEIERLGQLFLQAVDLIKQQIPDLQILLVAANQARYQQLQVLLDGYQTLSVRLSLANAQEVISAADVVLLASGTVALETMLLKKPMVVAYRMAPLTAKIIRCMLKQPYVSLPNLLANQALVPELIQEQASAENLSQAVLHWLQNPGAAAQLTDRFEALHRQLRCDASRRAADALIELMSNPS